MLEKDIERTLISSEDIHTKTQELGKQITADYADKNPLVIGILKGAVPFMADLVRAIDIHLEMDFMDVSTYHGGTTSTGEVKIEKDLNTSVEGRDILIVEDIIDSGRTLNYMRRNLMARSPASLRICTLLNKPARREIDVEVDYIGFDIPDEFVVGYGLDFDEIYRNLPFIAILKPAVFAHLFA